MAATAPTSIDRATERHLRVVAPARTPRPLSRDAQIGQVRRARRRLEGPTPAAGADRFAHLRRSYD